MPRLGLEITLIPGMREDVLGAYSTLAAPWLAGRALPCVNGCSSVQSDKWALSWHDRMRFLLHMYPHSDSCPPRLPLPCGNHLLRSALAWNSCNFWEREQHICFLRERFLVCKYLFSCFLWEKEKRCMEPVVSDSRVTVGKSKTTYFLGVD